MLDRSLVPWAMLLTVFAFAFGCPTAGAQQPRSLYEFTVDLEADNQMRIQKHLRELTASLRGKDVAHLSTEQQENRAALLQRLECYWRAGVFPQNRGQHGQRETFHGLRPVFIDEGQRACAVADLMIHSGAGALARRIAREQNYAYLPDIKTPGVASWAAQWGLTLDECAMIQPAYPCQLFSSSSCTVQGDDVQVTWQTIGYTPQSTWQFGVVTRDGVNVFNWSGADPGVFLDESVPDGSHTYEIYWEDALVCFDTASCTVQVGQSYIRGDISGDGAVTPLVDAIYLLNWGFAAGPAPVCMAAADIDGDGVVTAIADAVYFVSYQFVNGPQPPEPFAACGALSAAGGLGCAQLPVCP